jgi:hypothetical protein
MKILKKWWFWAAVLILIVVILFFVYLEKRNSNNLLACVKDSDCFCSSSCGCVTQSRGEANCFVLLKERKCIDGGCLCINNRCTVNSTIDTKEKAIEFAKTDKDFVQASERYKETFQAKLLYNAYWNIEKNSWEVTVWPEDTNDVWYYLEFDKQGQIISQGYGKGA